MQEGHPKFLPEDLKRAIAYLDRAGFAYNNAIAEELNPEARSMITAFCLHACQSLRESLEQFAELRSRNEMLESVRNLPNAPVIQDLRNQDLHGYPLPVCLPGGVSHMLQSDPKRPMKLSSSDGVSVGVQLIGVQPKVRLSPKKQNRGKFTMGSAMGYSCIDGVLFVRDFSRQQDLNVLAILYEYLIASEALVAALIDEWKGLQYGS